MSVGFTDYWGNIKLNAFLIFLHTEASFFSIIFGLFSSTHPFISQIPSKKSRQREGESKIIIGRGYGRRHGDVRWT